MSTGFLPTVRIGTETVHWSHVAISRITGSPIIMVQWKITMIHPFYTSMIIEGRVYAQT